MIVWKFIHFYFSIKKKLIRSVYTTYLWSTAIGLCTSYRQASLLYNPYQIATTKNKTPSNAYLTWCIGLHYDVCCGITSWTFVHSLKPHWHCGYIYDLQPAAQSTSYLNKRNAYLIWRNNTSTLI